MAKKAEAKSAPAPKDPTREEMAKLLADLNDIRDAVSEKNAQASDLVKGRLERHGLSRQAFGFIRTLARLEESKRQGILREVVKLAAIAGFLDQRDAFDDLPDFISGVLSDAGVKPSKRPGKGSAAVDRLLEQTQA